MTDKEKIIKELKEALDSLDITNKYRLNIIRAIEYLQEKPVEKDFEKALANEWKGYIDSGASTVDALEDNTQELAYAKGFYRCAKWKEQKDSIVSEELGKENKIEALADIIFYAAKHGYMPYNTQDEDCAMEIAKKNIDKFITQKA